MVIVGCGICKKTFYAKPCHIKLGYCKYCSKSCQAKAQKKGKDCKCAICRQEIYRSPQDLKRSKSGKFFCSKSCQTLWRNKYFSGDKHPNWKGGDNQLYRQKLMGSKTPKVCVKCGFKDIRVLSAHHVDRNRKNNQISNLVWLCRNCHFLEHFYKEDIL
ncbi:MAG: HNH endonuclease signature motif containing protein [bacterium]